MEKVSNHPLGWGPQPQERHYLVDILVLTIGIHPQIWVWGYMLGLRPNFYDPCCLWKKSCTTWDVFENLVNNGIFTISTGAGFLNHQQYESMNCCREYLGIPVFIWLIRLQQKVAFVKL